MIPVRIAMTTSYKHQDAEENWAKLWEDQQVYAWEENKARDDTYVVDTPPPTVSGSLHIGHVFSYTQTDLIVRFQRMRGKNIFYPMGWDDNGLPTERRVQNVFGIRCNPNIPYDPKWKASKKEPSKEVHIEEVSRQNFIEACHILTLEDEKAFESMWRRLGLSIDWKQTYASIDDHCRCISQLSFLDLAEKKMAYKKYAVTMWDVDFQSAVAQAEIEDRPKIGTYHDIAFQVKDSSESFIISTTRPELLPACVAVVAHPSDSRFQHLFGKKAITPLFHEEVPIMPSEEADPEKGTGIMMICTFGDIHDVAFWKKHQDILPLKQVLTLNGRFREHLSNSEAYKALEGLKINQGRRKIVELLKEAGLLIKETATEQAVKYYEKGDSPIEFMPSYQWFIAISEHKDALLAQGDKIQWIPAYMKTRYQNWVLGVNQDWCISRQRYFGVPFPVWYPMENGIPNFNKPIFANKEQLKKKIPVDPMTQCPEGYTESQRNAENGFIADPDVMDTWATSSLTPQLMSHWELNEERHQKLFPMDLRPQSHEIIRTWAFYTIAKAWMHEGQIPWKTVAISGWILDPDRKKMSKSKGNVITPEELLNTHSADALRYWASKARLGNDTAYDENMFAIGKKLCTKLFNASKFLQIQILGADNPNLLEKTYSNSSNTDVFDNSKIEDPLDLSFCMQLNQHIEHATKCFESYDYSAALEDTESFFWLYCDYYIELVKIRAYRGEEKKRNSAVTTLFVSLNIFLKLLAPFLPFITEEIWSWHHQDSIHRASWPKPEDCPMGDPALFDMASEILSVVRATKTQAQKNMKFPIKRLELELSPKDANAFRLIEADIRDAASIQDVLLSEHENSELKIKVFLAETESKI